MTHEKVRVFVIGHRGMLGHVVSRYLTERGYTVCTSAERYDGRPDSALLQAIQQARCSAVVNCARAVRKDGRVDDLMTVNGLLPLHVAARLDQEAILIHASSDGVFDGQRGFRRVSESPDAADDYGVSKRLGEACRCFASTVILRTSIVGPELGPPRSILGRVIGGGSFSGFVDHWWNGITTLEWAGLADDAIAGRLGSGIHQPASERVTKYDLASTICQVYRCRTRLDAAESGQPADRSLEPTIRLAPIDAQLQKLKEWYVDVRDPNEM